MNFQGMTSIFGRQSNILSLFVGSVPAPKSQASWVLCHGLGKTLDEMTVTIPHDLYVFGSQENSVCDREWVESLRALLKEQTELDYKPVRKQRFYKLSNDLSLIKCTVCI